MSEKIIKVYCYRPSGEHTWVVEQTKERFLESLVEELSNFEPEDEYLIEVCIKEMTKKQIKNLPDFDGW